MAAETRIMVTLLLLCNFIIALKWIESGEHKACLQSGGDVVLGWLQDGCTTRRATP